VESIFWDVASFRPLSVNRSLGLQGRRKTKQETV
jgi:hypothetical protein